MTLSRSSTIFASLPRLCMLIVLSITFSPAFAQTTYTVQPQGTLNLFAYCVNQYGQFVYNCCVGVYRGYYVNTGGHYHDNPPHTTSAYGSVSPTSGCYYGPPGLPITFTASTVGQKEWIDACANYCGTANIDVKYSDISAYFGHSTNVFVGEKPWHPANHFGTPVRIPVELATDSALKLASYSGRVGHPRSVATLE
jgi:hypothetical protein